MAGSWSARRCRQTSPPERRANESQDKERHCDNYRGTGGSDSGRGATRAAPRAIVRRPFYIGTSVLMGFIAVVGFWSTYFGPLVRGTSQPSLIHVHTVVFVGWLVLFLTSLERPLCSVGRRGLTGD